MIPRLSGHPILVQIRASLGPHHAATHIRRRVILLDAEVLTRRGEFQRILIHEIFHFAWVRLSNSNRLEWERLLSREIRRRERGELGWSAERLRKNIKIRDVTRRTRRWRLYACEAFCDSAAWLHAGLRLHEEFTLAHPARRRRAAFFKRLEREPGIRV